MPGPRLTGLVLRPEVIGATETVDGALLLAANHVAGIDRLVIQAALGRPLAEVDVDTVAGLHEARELLADGQAVVVFPEGAVSPDGRVHRGRIGLAELVVAAALPVTPVAVLGSDHPVRTFVPWAGDRVQVVFGDSHDFSRFADVPHEAPVLQAIVDEVVHAIVRLSGLGYVDDDADEHASALRRQRQSDQVAAKTQRVADREARRAAEQQARAEAAAEAAEFAAMQAAAETAAREQAKRAAEQDELRRRVRQHHLEAPLGEQTNVADPRHVRADPPGPAGEDT